MVGRWAFNARQAGRKIALTVCMYFIQLGVSSITSTRRLLHSCLELIVFVQMWVVVAIADKHEDDFLGPQLSFAFVDPSPSEVMQEVRGRLVRLARLVARPDVDSHLKSKEIDEFFHHLSFICQRDCSKVLEALNRFSKDSAQGKRPGDKGEKSEGEQRMYELANIDVLVDSLVEGVTGAMAHYQEHPEEFARQIQAGIAGVRAVIRIEEEVIFRGVSGNEEQRRKAAQELQKDIQFQFKQLKALVHLGELFAKVQKKEAVSHEDAKEFVKTVSELGVFYIKLAQSISNLSLALPKSLTSALRVLQEDVDPIPPDVVLQVIEEEYGVPADQIFIDFDPTKYLATGSIGQTYLVKLRRGDKVTEEVLKVQRPGIAEELRYIKRVNSVVLELARGFVEKDSVPVLDVVADQLLGVADSFEEEMDFELEARKLKRFGRWFSLFPGVRIPKVNERLSRKRVLVMSKLEGKNMDRAVEELQQLDLYFDSSEKSFAMMDHLDRVKYMTAPENRNKQAYTEAVFGHVLDSVLYMVFMMGELHSDLHPGNLFAPDYDPKQIGAVNVGSKFRQRFRNGIDRGMVFDSYGPVQNAFEQATTAEQRLKMKSDSAIGLLDFGQTVKTKGVILLPIKLALGGFTGRPAYVAKILHQMQIDGRVSVKTIQGIVEEEFEKAKIKYVETKEAFKFRLNDSTVVGPAFGKIVSRLFQFEGYRAKPTYVKVIRGLLPATSSLISIGRTMSPAALAASFVKSALRLPVNYLKYLAVRFPNKLLELTDALDLADKSFDRYVDGVKAAHDQSEGMCRALFSDD